MKKVALVLSLLAASTTAAWAQSSVQLYGIIDAAVRKTSNANVGVSENQLIPGGMSQSRLGVNVTEDMGGGLKAIANLEHRLNSDTGVVAAADFWRQSWVGLQSNDFGRITVGRQYNVLFDLVTSSYASFRYSPYIEVYKPEIGMLLNARQDNMVKYLMESGPVRFEAQISAGEGAQALNKSVGAIVRYASGPFVGGVGFQQVTDPAGKKVKAMTLGGSYTIGQLALNASMFTNKFDAGSVVFPALAAGFTVPLTTQSADAKKRDMIMFGATYQLTTAFNLGAQFWRLSQSHFSPALTAKSKVNYFAVVADYAFSKRTDAYVEFDRTSTDGAMRIGTGTAAAATNFDNRSGFTVGLRHRF
jgi:predicted porin